MTNLTFDPDNTLAGGLYSMSPRETIELGIDLCAAVESGFGANGCHGSIWPGNVSLADGKVFLGPSQQLSVKEMKPDALEYIAPEQFWSGENTPAADVYSIGLILYTALNGGVMPFFDGKSASPETRAAALQSRMRGSAVPYPRTASRELGDVVLKAIAFRREDRYSEPAQLRLALQSLPDGAAVPAAVPVIPLSSEEVKTARSYKVDKEFERVEPPKPKKVKKQDPVKEQKEIENFRNPKKGMPGWVGPAVLVLVIAAAAVIWFKSCSAGEEDPEPTPPLNTIETSEPTPPASESTPEPTPSPTAEATEPPVVSEPTYQVIIEDVTWEQARDKCVELGGHLATIKSDAELSNIIELVEQAGASFVWLGAYRADDGQWYYVTGEDMTYGVWDTNEPSAYDGDGTAENCLLMWNSKTRNIWCFNDTRNDPISVLPRTYSGKTAYICQFD